MNCSPPGSSVCGILQARILEWVAIPFFSGSSQPRDRTLVSCIAGRFFTVSVTSSVQFSSVALSCPILCDPMDGSLPVSSVRGILQARIPEWVAILFLRGSSRPRDGTQVSCIAGASHLNHQGSPRILQWVAYHFFRGSS